MKKKGKLVILSLIKPLDNPTKIAYKIPRTKIVFRSIAKNDRNLAPPRRKSIEKVMGRNFCINGKRNDLTVKVDLPCQVNESGARKRSKENNKS